MITVNDCYWFSEDLENDCESRKIISFPLNQYNSFGIYTGRLVKTALTNSRLMKAVR